MTTPSMALARFQVLSAAVTPGPAERLDDAYVFAWQAGIYPIFHSDGLHTAFEAEFEVREGVLSALLQKLDDTWLSGSVPNFYKIEQDYGGRHGAPLSRESLIDALRYAYLSNRFGPDFFAAVLAPGSYPIEASSITTAFDRSQIELS